MIKKTILQYIVFTALFNFALCSAVATYVTFLTANGLNLFQVNLVNLVFFTVRLLCEIPTGAFADVFGRKYSFVLSCFLFAIGGFVYALSRSFIGFAIAEGLSAIGSTFASGAFDAWLVDKLAHHGHKEGNDKVFSRAEIVGKVIGIGAALVGSYLADINASFPWLLEASTFLFTGILAMFWMKEEYFKPQAFSWKLAIDSFKATFKASVDYGIKNKMVRFIVVVGLIQMLALQAPNMQWQPYFMQFLIHKKDLGYMWVGMSLFLMIGALLAPKLRLRIKDEKKALVLCQVFMGLSLAAVVLFPFPLNLVMFLLHEIPRGMYVPLKKKFLHDNIPSKERATIASFESIMPHFGGMIGLVGSGWIANSFGITPSWIISGCLLVAVTLFVARNGVKK